jgi:hypothetical protein
MGEVQGQALVADLNADGKMEVFVGELLQLSHGYAPWRSCVQEGDSPWTIVQAAC